MILIYGHNELKKVYLASQKHNNFPIICTNPLALSEKLGIYVWCKISEEIQNLEKSAVHLAINCGKHLGLVEEALSLRVKYIIFDSTHIQKLHTQHSSIIKPAPITLHVNTNTPIQAIEDWINAKKQ